MNAKVLFHLMQQSHSEMARNCTTTLARNTLGIDHTAMLATLVNAVRELNEVVVTQQAQIKSQQAQLDALRMGMMH